MPRKSGHGSEESPTPRRTSARIAAAQAASPAKSPAKSPRRKRQSAESNKAISEDTESQRSQLKSESSVEELNGLEVSSSTKEESVADPHELPSKKLKSDEVPDVEQSESAEVTREVNEPTAEPISEVSESISPKALDFEVVEAGDLPAPNSAEVKAAVSVQGEDGQLLAGFVQVDKSELPVTSVEVKQPTLLDEPVSEPEKPVFEGDFGHPLSPVVNNVINGDGLCHTSGDVADTVVVPSAPAEPDLQSKFDNATEAPMQLIPPAIAGDSTADAMISETAP